MAWQPGQSGLGRLCRTRRHSRDPFSWDVNIAVHTILGDIRHDLSGVHVTSLVTTLVPKLGKHHRLFADSGRKKTPFFQPKSLILKSNKRPPFKAKRDSIFIIQDKVPFFESEINCIKQFYCVHLIWNEYLNTRPGSKVRKPGKQADTSKMFNLFQNFADLCLQNIPFCWFCEFAPPLKNYPFFRESGYGRGIRFDRESGAGPRPLIQPGGNF